MLLCSLSGSGSGCTYAYGMHMVMLLSGNVTAEFFGEPNRILDPDTASLSTSFSEAHRIASSHHRIASSLSLLSTQEIVIASWATIAIHIYPLSLLGTLGTNDCIITQFSLGNQTTKKDLIIQDYCIAMSTTQLLLPMYGERLKVILEKRRRVKNSVFPFILEVMIRYP
jgi:hypothetical protein